MREHPIKGVRFLWPSLRALAVDLAIAFVLLVAGSAYWFGHQGVGKIAAARQSCEQEWVANREALRATREALAAAQVETEALSAEQAARLEEANALAGRIQEEQLSLTALWEEQRPLIERAADLQERIAKLDAGASQRRIRLGDMARRIEGKRDEVSALVLRLEKRRQTVTPASDLQAQQVMAIQP